MTMMNMMVAITIMIEMNFWQFFSFNGDDDNFFINSYSCIFISYILLLLSNISVFVFLKLCIFVHFLLYFF